jgi:hypothetical protein
MIEYGCAAIRRYFGPDHPDVVTCLLAIAIAKHSVGDLEGSIAAAEGAVSVASRQYAPTNPVVLQTAGVLQQVCHEAGRPEVAIAILRENGLGLGSAIRGDHP